MSVIKEGKRCPVSRSICTREECQSSLGGEYCTTRLRPIFTRIEFLLAANNGRRDMDLTQIFENCTSYEEKVALAGVFSNNGEFDLGIILFRAYVCENIAKMIANKK